MKIVNKSTWVVIENECHFHTRAVEGIDFDARKIQRVGRIEHPIVVKVIKNRSADCISTSRGGHLGLGVPRKTHNNQAEREDDFNQQTRTGLAIRQRKKRS